MPGGKSARHGVCCVSTVSSLAVLNQDSGRLGRGSSIFEWPYLAVDVQDTNCVLYHSPATVLMTLTLKSAVDGG